mgnify:CR=1 FL=1
MNRAFQPLAGSRFDQSGCGDGSDQWWLLAVGPVGRCFWRTPALVDRQHVAPKPSAGSGAADEPARVQALAGADVQGLLEVRGSA